jgi:hypothetical protein
MRWFVEVSGIGDSSASEKLCIEAKQWQSALQEARRLRGDPGPLSKFSIEVLDEGYRAVNSALKTRYLVRPAPSDAPLTEGARERLSSHPPPAEIGEAMLGAVKSSAAPAASAAPGVSSGPADGSKSNASANGPESVPESQVIRQHTDEPTAENPILYYEAAYSVRPGVTRTQAERALLYRFQKVCAEIDRRQSKKFVQLAIFDHQYAKRPVRAPLATLTWKDWRGAPVLGFPAFGEKAASGSMAPPPDWDKSSGVAVSMPITAPEQSVPRTSAPGSVPPPAKPVSVPPSTPAVQVIRSVPVGESVSATSPQIPKAAPLPAIVEHPSDAELAREPPAREEPAVIASASDETKSVSVTEETKSPSEPPAGEHRQTLPAPEGISTAPAPAPEPRPTVPAEERASAKLTVAPEQLPAEEPAPAKAAPSTSEEASAEAPASRKNGAPSSRPGKKAKKSGPKSSSGKSSSGKSKPGTRRSAGEDLISELFEQMHELHFMRDIASGSEFVLSVLRQVLPSEAILVQVFDINSRNFVVVRAFPDVRDALLLRTSDSDPIVREVMRRPTSLRVGDAAKDGRFASEIWNVLGVTPRVALCGPVRQGGRYLGLIQLANPLGGAPFHDSEANALDYVCQQFAEFVANRPIVLEADTIFPPQ